MVGCKREITPRHADGSSYEGPPGVQADGTTVKMVLEMKKKRKVCKAIKLEIHANEDIIEMMIRSGMPDVELPVDTPLKITRDKSKKMTSQ